MIDRHTFTEILTDIRHYDSQLGKLENALDVVFDNSWLDAHITDLVFTLSRSFFNDKEMYLHDIDNSDDETKAIKIRREMVESLILFFMYDGNWGSETDVLKDIYVRGDNPPISAYTTDDVYSIIYDYLTTSDNVVFHF